MYDTTIISSRGNNGPGMTYEKLIQEMDPKLQFPGLSKHLDHARRKSFGYGIDGHKDAARIEDSRTDSGRHSTTATQIQQLLSSLPESAPFSRKGYRKASISTLRSIVSKPPATV